MPDLMRVVSFEPLWWLVGLWLFILARQTDWDHRNHPVFVSCVAPAICFGVWIGRSWARYAVKTEDPIAPMWMIEDLEKPLWLIILLHRLWILVCVATLGAVVGCILVNTIEFLVRVFTGGPLLLPPGHRASRRAQVTGNRVIGRILIGSSIFFVGLGGVQWFEEEGSIVQLIGLIVACGITLLSGIRLLRWRHSFFWFRRIASPPDADRARGSSLGE